MPANRLIHEKSPYLLQHAQNPVDWYPWGEEAFAKARSEDKPIFLSIGYSTCHWCHVMERESFENAEIAAILNRSFVPVKVDREERPDVDRVYMTYVQAATGSGGWPMSVWLAPDLKPFFGGTYFPPDGRYGRPGFGALLTQIATAWITDRQRIVDSGRDAIEQLKRAAVASPAGAIAEESRVRNRCFLQFRRIFDPRLGGFGGPPKFPRPVTLNFLLRESVWSVSEEARDMVLLTLREMAKGGMHDQVGGGFHRYSVDAEWFVPHFEKMLYDQAQLAVAYLEAFQVTGEAIYANVARRIFEYVERDLRHPDGGFYSAEDADSAADPAHPHEKREGAFYVWTDAEIGEVLGEDAGWFRRRYGVQAGGNVRPAQDPHQEFTGQNILFLAQEAGEPDQIERAHARLMEIRSRRVRPHLDDKVLAAWNGLMISALAKGAQALGDGRYLELARQAARFIRERMFTADGILLRRWREGEAAIPGFLDDYAALGNAFLDLYETGFDPSDLTMARTLATQMRLLFEDPDNGGFFSTVEGDENLVLRIKEDYDGAEPSGNALAIQLLLRLGDREPAERALRAFASRLEDSPMTLPQMVIALAASQRSAQQVVFAGDRQGLGPLVEAAHRHFSPFRVLLHNPSDHPEFTPIEGRAAAYVCQDFTCQLPVTTAGDLERLLT
jgi:uncharacterized protein YyaL (SSP411 family)